MDESDGGRSLRAECIVIGEGKIIGRGTREEVRREWGDLETTGRGVRIFWLSKDETVLPGLIDAHAHVLQQGEAANSVDLVGAASVAEVVERIAAFVAADPEVAKDRTKFVMGLGWDQTKFKETGGDFPTAAHLEHDPRLAGRPIYLKRIDVHALWVSPAVLVLLPPDLPEVVPGGQIVRDPTTGEPTGVFLDNAMDYINAVIPPWTSSSRLRFLLSTSRSMLAHGLTGVHDAALAPADVRFLRDLDKDGKLPVRIYGMVGCVPTNSWCGDEEGVETYEGERLTVRAAKIFTDGALGSWGAAMHEPYSDAPDKKGFLITEEPELRELMGNWVSKGFQLASHGIGDRANTVVLDIYESLLRNLTFTDGRDGTDIAEVRKTQERVRWRVEHAQIMTPEDIERMGRLGIIASFQPTHATSDMGYAEQRIGAERIKGAYAWRSLLESGAPFALGSDFPVELVNPFHGIYSAITRKWPNGDSPHVAEGWYPRERLTILEALRGFTTLAAYSSFSTSNQGMLRPSFPADFIVVQGDLLELGTERMDETAEERRTRERKLRETEVRTTVVGGRVMHGKGL
ncbi:amidohydrolase family protein [Rhodotorula toruloides]|uniref:Amidohydrolase family protein n=1 Tax=Rhodotorula toruloides TaxID=5286 RepID=A0A511KMD5_RHOTO|nr:amidohydrolase family protein [Rhodotorula toruloides]